MSLVLTIFFTLMMGGGSFLATHWGEDFLGLGCIVLVVAGVAYLLVVGFLGKGLNPNRIALHFMLFETASIVPICLGSRLDEMAGIFNFIIPGFVAAIASTAFTIVLAKGKLVTARTVGFEVVLRGRDVG